MVFTPDALYSSQSLVLDPTGPSHIHLRAPGANIDEPDANIFLGGETSSFEVGYYNGAAPNLFIHSNNNTWTFDTTGILAFPRDTDPNVADPILTIVGGANPSISAIDASLAGPANLGISALTTIFTGFTGDAIKIYPDDGEIGSTANLQIWANSGGNTEYSWTFDTTGNLTTPSNLVIGSGPGSGSSIFQYNEGLQILGEGANSVVQLGWTANTSAPDSVATIAMNYPSGGEGNILIAVGNNATTVNYWLFDNTGNLRLPGNTFAVNYANGTAVTIPTVGNIATINLDGSNTNVLYGNGIFAAIPAPTVAQDITSNGAMSIMLYDGNIKYNNYATVEPSTGNIAGGNISANGAVTANTANITTGNITTINSGLLQNGNSNITITSNGNVSIQAAGSTVELVVTSTGANITGTLDATGNITGGNISTSGNVSAGNVIINGQTLIATGTVTATVVANTSPNLSSFSNGTSTSPATTVFTLSIPSAGTWQLEAWIRTFSTTGTPLISGGFYTGGTLVANSETLLWPTPVTNANGAGYMSTTVTTAGAATYTVGLWSTATGIGLYSDSTGRTKAQATQLSSIFALNAIDTMTTTGNVTVGGNLTVTDNISTTGAVTANTANITTGNITTINSGLLQNGNSNITITSNGNVSIQAAGSNVELVVTSTGANVTGTLTSTGKIGYASGSTVTQTTNRGNGVTINALAGTIITTSASMVANQIDTFSVANDQVDTNNDIVLVQVVSPNLGNYNVIANPNSGIGGFYLTLQNISGFPISAEAITIRFMVIKAPNA
jgi:hypothetical protein